MKSLAIASTVMISLSALSTTAAEARSCADIRALCWTMRSDKSDCTKPYRRCLTTGVFITPLGRVFKATSP